MTYKLYKNPMTGNFDPIVIRLSDNASIPFDPDNTDYQEYFAGLRLATHQNPQRRTNNGFNAS